MEVYEIPARSQVARVPTDEASLKRFWADLNPLDKRALLLASLVLLTRRVRLGQKVNHADLTRLFPLLETGTPPP